MRRYVFILKQKEEEEVLSIHRLQTDDEMVFYFILSFISSLMAISVYAMNLLVCLSYVCLRLNVQASEYECVHSEKSERRCVRSNKNTFCLYQNIQTKCKRRIVTRSTVNQGKLIVEIF